MGFTIHQPRREIRYSLTTLSIRAKSQCRRWHKASDLAFQTSKLKTTLITFANNFFKGFQIKYTGDMSHISDISALLIRRFQYVIIEATVVTDITVITTSNRRRLVFGTVTLFTKYG